MQVNTTGGPNGNGIAFGRNALWVAAQAGEKDVKFWDPRTGQELRSLSIGTGNLLSPVALSPNGHFAAAQGEGCCAVKVWNAATGEELQTLTGQTMGISALGFSPDGKLLASGSINGDVRLWEVASGRQLPAVPLDGGIVTAVVFNRDGSRLATAAQADAAIRIWDVATGHEIRSFPSPYGNTALAFTHDGRYLAFYGAGNTIQLWDLETGREVRILQNNTGPSTVLCFSPNGQFLASGSGDGTITLWDVSTGALLATLVSAGQGNVWAVTTPDGLFDGSQRGTETLVAWRFGQHVYPAEVFFNEFFYPGLLGDVLAGKHPRAPKDIAHIDRRQPSIELSLLSSGAAAASSISSRNVMMRVRVAQAPPDQDHAEGSGVRDVRLFRNGSLVKIWHGPVPLNAHGEATLEAPVTLVAGENALTAYGFNDDNIKSTDAALTLTGADSLRRRGTFYILAIGINQYANPSFRLHYADSDAQVFAKDLARQQRQLNNYAQVRVISLLDDQATRANILLALHRLAGVKSGRTPASAPSPLAPLSTAQPEDALFIYFAGHGTAQGSRFYLIPHDLGYRGSRSAIDARGFATILAHSISDLTLERDFEGIDAGRIALIIDACNSGQALNASDWRRGPMNSRGLAQLAWEKGMDILTAAQGYQEALEINRLGHGLLTYALVEKGLDQVKASRSDRVVYLRDWLDYAAQEVPNLQREWLQGKLAAGRGVIVLGKKVTDPSRIALQRPRVFHRREREAHPLVVARREGIAAGKH